MLGPVKLRCLDRPVAVSLEDLVPANHFYRHLDAKLNLSFVRELVRDCYAERGRPSIDPIIFFKLQLVMFFEGIRSERRLLETAHLHLAQRWYLGYHLDEPLPDHSSLSKIRTRLGLPIFRRFFERVVELCQQAGLVWGKELFVDATKVRANADVDSLQGRLHEVSPHLTALFDEGTEAPAEPPTRGEVGAPMSVPSPVVDEGATPPSDVVALPRPGQDGGPAVEAAGSRWSILDACQLDPARPIGEAGYERISFYRVSTTDPDATAMRMGGQTCLGYHDHYVVDGGKARIILQALITPADVMENQPMLDLLWRVRFRWKLHPRRVVADTTYATGDNIAALHAAGLRAYMPLPDWDKQSPYYPRSAFTYEAEADVYRCPEGQPLRRISSEAAEGRLKYRAQAATCNACPVKAACTGSQTGRTLYRSPHAHELAQVRADHATPAYQKAMRKRKVWIEPLFGEAKQWHGLRQFRLRGLPKVNMEGLIIATGQNLKRWLSATGWGRRHGPAGSLLAPRLVAIIAPVFS
jgi:transposase